MTATNSRPPTSFELLCLTYIGHKEKELGSITREEKVKQLKDATAIELKDASYLVDIYHLNYPNFKIIQLS